MQISGTQQILVGIFVILAAFLGIYMMIQLISNPPTKTLAKFPPGPKGFPLIGSISLNQINGMINLIILSP